MPSHVRLMPRTECRLRVRFSVCESSSKWVAFSNNVSAHGMFLITNRQEEPGCYLWLEVDLPEGAAVLRAVVVWRRQVHVSLRSAVKPGIGLLVVQAPESWYRFLVSLGWKSKAEHRSQSG